MMVITHIVLVDTSTPTPLIAGCNSDGLHMVAPHCSDAFPVLFTSLSSFLGHTVSLHLLVQCWYMSVHLSARLPGAVCMIRVV